jgi:signal transduction histidine kinase
MDPEQRQLPREAQALDDLCAHLQERAERHRASIADQLHDEIGGLLVAARLNVAWLEERLPSEDPLVHMHYKRLHDALRHGVEVKRRIVEELRPTLLDNIGLYAALRWHLAKTCESAKLPYTEQYPDDELLLRPAAAVLVFRIVEGALHTVVMQAQARRVHLELQETPASLRVYLRDSDRAAGPGGAAPRAADVDDMELATLGHRVRRLGGVFQRREPDPATRELEILVPLARLLLSGSERG